MTLRIYFAGNFIGAFLDLALNLAGCIFHFLHAATETAYHFRQLIGTEEHNNDQDDDEYFTGTEIQKKRMNHRVGLICTKLQNQTGRRTARARRWMKYC